MMMMKRGQGLSMNVIIIAAIALLVLVILSVLVIQAGKNTGQANACESTPGAYCTDLDDRDKNYGCDPGDERDTFKSCPDDDGPQVCCRTV